MPAQVIVDFENTSFWRLWFFTYYAASFILLLAYSFWAGWLTSDDKTVSVWPQLSIVAMQSLLLFMFWLNIVSMEEQLVPLNKVIENSPNSAKVSCSAVLNYTPGQDTLRVCSLRHFEACPERS